MRKTLTTLSLAMAVFAGQAMADPATTASLQTYGVPLTAEQAAAITSAEGQQLVDAIAALIAAQPEMAATIVAVAIKVNPCLTDKIVAAAINAAPAQEQAILAAVKVGVSLPKSSLPSMGGSGGGNTSLASPN